MSTVTKDNLILCTDSYKVAHHLQYPSGMTGMFDYLESRGGKHESVLFFGLQYYLLHYLQRRITKEDVEEARDTFAAHFGTGLFFPYDGWMKVVNEHDGRLPIRIRAIPEGTLVPTRTSLFSVESTDPELFWLVSWVEGLLQKVWYPTTVATEDFFTKQVIYDYLSRTSDNADAEIGFKLHDFGYRGVSSEESAKIGGAAALVNFLGTDTVPALKFLQQFYDEPMAGFSIAASEHSTMTTWGREDEARAYQNMIEKFGEQPIFACVSDSYDLWNAASNLWGELLRERVEEMGATLVVRPDSGDPVEVNARLIKILDEKFGSTINSKGFKVLNNVRVIQGDGIKHDGVINEILWEITNLGFSTENIAFGMGGGRLQQMNRDTQKFAIKCSAATIDGQAVDVFKDPVTDPGKHSKKGYIDTIPSWLGYESVSMPYGQPHPNSLKRVVYENGEVLITDSLADVRARAEKAFRSVMVVEAAV